MDLSDPYVRRRWRNRAIGLGVIVAIIAGFVITSLQPTDPLGVHVTWRYDENHEVIGYHATMTNHTGSAVRASCDIEAISPDVYLVRARDHFETEVIQPGASISHDGALIIEAGLGNRVSIRTDPNWSCEPIAA